ncbi:MAG TPA: GIY-YIG nuclease family protein [Candidatus Saccharimonadales bacterium]
MKHYIIYRILNLINLKSYIGISSNYRRRWKGHIKSMNWSEFPLPNAMRKYGLENFKFEIIYEANSVEQMKILETHFIIMYNSFKKNWGYNQTWGGDGITGYKFTEEQNEKNRQMMLGNQWALGNHHTPEQKEQWSKDRKGKKNSSSHNEAISLGMKGRIAWNKGLTKEDPRIKKGASKVSKALTGKKRKPFTEEHKRNMSIAQNKRIERNKNARP